MRADLAREYHLDLDNALAGDLSPFALADLVIYLPQHSQLWAAINPQDAIWDHHAMLTAYLIDQINDLRHMLTGRKGPQPDPYPRPGYRPDVDTIGASEGFDTISEYDTAYKAWRARYETPTK